MQQQILKLIH